MFSYMVRIITYYFSSSSVSLQLNNFIFPHRRKGSYLFLGKKVPKPSPSELMNAIKNNKY
ncbi:hypothetical protein SAMN04488023_1531 [Pedobacter rhizosphaerae]|uniref:Uncharacterized protein n=1 Tax=Pedobacter rhizosphaerae TaxID=390241 RepID=A0A1H9VZC1_9SPHI|nr:hypothetical protein SAMN04488023_1531 [Pedobacter rhizosphaerae]